MTTRSAPPGRRSRATLLPAPPIGIRAVPWIAVACAVVSALWLAFRATVDQRWVLGPALAICCGAFLFVGILYARDGLLPVFEIGTLFVLALTLYSVVPLVNYAAAGMRWTSVSDGRLLNYDSTPSEVGSFAFRHILFFACFALIYLKVRGSVRPNAGAIPLPDRSTEVGLVFLLIVLTVYFLGFSTYMGPTATAYQGGNPTQALRERVPFFIAQITHILISMRFTVKQCVVAMFMGRWRSRAWRFTFFLWIAFEVFSTIRALASRGEMFLLLLTAGLLYHRYVKPMTFKKASVLGTLFITGFLTLGLLRDFKDASPLTTSFAPIWSNEFQTLWANAYDLHMRRLNGQLPEIPWQIYVSDFYMIIPSQLLPFQKIDPSDWYLDVLGAADSGQGFMFGAIAQGVVGLDWIEIGIRGALLGVVFALLHRFYVRHRRSFWVMSVYLFVCVWVYYAFRSTTFCLIYMVLYQFVTVWAAVQLIRLLVTRVNRVRGHLFGPPVAA